MMAASLMPMEPLMPTQISASKNTIYLALELSNSTWLAAARLPEVDKVVVHRMDAGDTAGLLAFVATLCARARALLGVDVEVVSCFEAGRDGFWLHRLLIANGVSNHVVEPTSVLVNRRSRRAKTDRLDAQGLLRVLAAHHRGDGQICSVVRAPSPEEEDAKRPHREREHLVRERVRIENRIAALLVTQGIRKRPSLRSWDADLATLRTADGRDLPPHLHSEVARLKRRLVLTLELIREVEAERDATLSAAPPGDEACRKIAALSRIRGVGDNFATVLTREVFYRRFSGRRQLASYVGIAPMPHQSGTMDRDRRIGRAGNPRARTTLIQLAWLWLRYQPNSQLTKWFSERSRGGNPRHKRVLIVALGRKLLVALWRYLKDNQLPEGALCKS